ncbi:hypothetical protein K443DRAFT_682336, partial [Laccaria amethystina LaAM-08-1]
MTHPTPLSATYTHRYAHHLAAAFNAKDDNEMLKCRSSVVYNLSGMVMHELWLRMDRGRFLFTPQVTK